MSNIKLNPCPVCKTKASVITGYWKDSFVKCFGCGLSTAVCDSEENAIAEWNSIAEKFNQVGCSVGEKLFKEEE